MKSTKSLFSRTDSLYAREVMVEQTASRDIIGPRTDDRRTWDVVFGVYGFPALLLAHKLKLFSLLASRPRSLAQVCETLGIKRRPAEAILTAAVALGFLELRNRQYSLTPLTEDYLLDQSPKWSSPCKARSRRPRRPTGRSRQHRRVALFRRRIVRHRTGFSSRRRLHGPVAQTQRSKP
jgi:Dimerisation domain